MKIKTNTSLAGVGVSYVADREYDIDDAEAERLIAAGFASASDPDYKPKPTPKAERVTMDAKASTPVENVAAVSTPATPPVATNAALTTETVQPKAAPTAVDVAKKAGK